MDGWRTGDGRRGLYIGGMYISGWGNFLVGEDQRSQKAMQELRRVRRIYRWFFTLLRLPFLAFPGGRM